MVAGPADWTHRGEYMFQRHGIRPAWANEALLDPDAVELDPDPASKSGKTARTIGWSSAAGRLVTVITLSFDGELHGVNGWASNSSDQRRYREEAGNE